MECPKCGKKIERVIIDVCCWQPAYLAEGTNVVKSYGPMEVADSSNAVCPECFKDIDNYIQR